ncbi:hypothetical protein TorRG33x02_015710, partial [Trema orientale]
MGSYLIGHVLDLAEEIGMTGYVRSGVYTNIYFRDYGCSLSRGSVSFIFWPTQ